ncbi:glucosaminidase domain-containing protein [Candidatus Riflebacteria bacterium]
MFKLILFSLLLFCITLAPVEGVPMSSYETIDGTDKTGSSANQKEINEGATTSLKFKINAPAKVPYSRPGEVYNCYWLNFRARPWGTIYQSYPRGTKVKVFRLEGSWYQVEVGGKKGYMHSKYVRILGAVPVKPGGPTGPAPSWEDPYSEVRKIQKLFDGYASRGEHEALMKSLIYALTYLKGVKNPKIRFELVKAIQKASVALTNLHNRMIAGYLGQPGSRPGGGQSGGSGSSGSGSPGGSAGSGSYSEKPPRDKPPLPRSASREQRLNYYADDIIYGGCSVGVPPSIVAAQFILESSAGKSMPAGSNNPFGIKCGSASNCVSARTAEYYGGKKQYITARFRVFNSVGEAIREHASRLRGKTRGLSGVITRPFNAALKRRDYNGLIDSGLLKYATSGSYRSDIKSIIRSNRLKERFDTKCPAVRDML